MRRQPLEVVHIYVSIKVGQTSFAERKYIERSIQGGAYKVASVFKAGFNNKTRRSPT